MSIGGLSNSAQWESTLMMMNIMMRDDDTSIVEVSDGTGDPKRLAPAEEQQVMQLLAALGYDGKDSFQSGSWKGSLGAIQNINQNWGGTPPIPRATPRHLVGTGRTPPERPDLPETSEGGSTPSGTPETAIGARPERAPVRPGATTSTTGGPRGAEATRALADKFEGFSFDDLVDEALGFATLLAVAKTVIAGREEAQLSRQMHREAKFASQRAELSKMAQQINAMKEKAANDLAFGLAFAIVQAVLSAATLGAATWVTTLVNTAMTFAKTMYEAMDKESGAGRRIDDLELAQMNEQIVQALEEALENTAKDSLDQAREEFKKMLQLLSSIIQANAQQTSAITAIGG